MVCLVFQVILNMSHLDDSLLARRVACHCAILQANQLVLDKAPSPPKVSEAAKLGCSTTEPSSGGATTEASSTTKRV